MPPKKIISIKAADPPAYQPVRSLAEGTSSRELLQEVSASEVIRYHCNEDVVIEHAAKGDDQRCLEAFVGKELRSVKSPTNERDDMDRPGLNGRTSTDLNKFNGPAKPPMAEVALVYRGR